MFDMQEKPIPARQKRHLKRDRHRRMGNKHTKVGIMRSQCLHEMNGMSPHFYTRVAQRLKL